MGDLDAGRAAGGRDRAHLPGGAALVPGPLTRLGVQRWVVGRLDSGLASKTVGLRLTAVKTFSRWAAGENELDTATSAAIQGIRAPKVDVAVIEPYSDDELKRLLATCAGDFGGARDRALISFMVESGARAGEVAALQLGDVDVRRGIAIVRRGKGGRGRIVPFSPQCARALDRWLRIRKTHSKAGTDKFWLGVRGAGFGYSALWLALGARAEKAGLDGFHPQRLRHTAAHRWLAAGGSGAAACGPSPAGRLGRRCWPGTRPARRASGRWLRQASWAWAELVSFAPVGVAL